MPENKGTGPEQFRNLRRERKRSYLAELPHLQDGGVMLLDETGPRQAVAGSPLQLLKSHSCNGARRKPGCTFFSSPPCHGEVIIMENTGILPEQFTDLRRELGRSYLATFQRPNLEGDEFQDVSGAGHGRGRRICLTPGRACRTAPDSTSVIMPYILMPARCSVPQKKCVFIPCFLPLLLLFEEHADLLQLVEHEQACACGCDGHFGRCLQGWPGAGAVACNGAAAPDRCPQPSRRSSLT